MKLDFNQWDGYRKVGNSSYSCTSVIYGSGTVDSSVCAVVLAILIEFQFGSKLYLLDQ
jgi:hypothetical protein